MSNPLVGPALSLNLTGVEPLMWASVQHNMPFRSLPVGGGRLVSSVAVSASSCSPVSHGFWEHGPQACGFPRGDAQPKPAFVPST